MIRAAKKPPIIRCPYVIAAALDRTAGNPVQFTMKKSWTRRFGATAKVEVVAIPKSKRFSRHCSE